MISSFAETKKSIEKYGGFYIGRYEVGNVSTDKLVVQRMNSDIASYQNTIKVSSKIKYLAGNNNVKTSLIYGCLWDETLQWLVDTGDKTYAELCDSTSWGNYKDATFEYESIYGTTQTKEADVKVLIPTGSSEYAKANNIYDLAGNILEYSLERNSTNDRFWRGGYYVSNGEFGVDTRVSGAEPTETDNAYGWRAYMYIQ